MSIFFYSKSGNFGEVQQLIKNGADVNHKYGDGIRTSLHEAAYNGYFSICKLLLENGANPDLQDIYGDTPLHDAVCNDSFEICELLIMHGADITIENKSGDTPREITGENEILDLFSGSNTKACKNYG